MPDHFIQVKLEVEDPQVKRDLQEAISSLEGVQIKNAPDSSPCDVLILEVREHLKTQFLQSLQSSGLAGEIFLTSSRLEPELLIEAMRAGVKEFFSQPLKKEEVHRAFLKFQERKKPHPAKEQPKKLGQIINVIGSKGGVGTTTLAVNLATSLAEIESSLSLVLIDRNLLFGEVPAFLDIKSAFNWGEVARNISRLDPTYLMSILSKPAPGFFVLPSPTGLDGGEVATPEVMEKLLHLMREVFDFILIDSGMSIDETSLKILEMSDSVLLVATLSVPCLTNVKRLLWTFQKLGYPPADRIKIIGNRYHRKSIISLKDAEQSIHHKLFWLVPNDFATTMSAINQGKPLSAVAPGTEICKSFRELAFTFLPAAENGRNKNRSWSKLFR